PFVHAGCRAGATDLAIVLRRGLMPAQLVLEARLQLQESLETGIRLSSRHAPTWRPLDHTFRPRHGSRLLRTGPLAAVDKIPRTPIDPAALFRASFNPLIETSEKGRKEGAWSPPQGRKRRV